MDLVINSYVHMHVMIQLHESLDIYIIYLYIIFY